MDTQEKPPPDWEEGQRHRPGWSHMGSHIKNQEGCLGCGGPPCPPHPSQTLPKAEEEETPPNTYEANITVIAKPDKDTTRKENDRLIALMKTDVKLNKILANQILQHVKRSIRHDQLGFSPGCKHGSTSAINKRDTPQ